MTSVKMMVCCVIVMVLALLAGNYNESFGGVKCVAAQDESIASVVSGQEDLSVLLEAAELAGLTEALSDPTAELTVFAPTNDAFLEFFGVLGVEGLEDIPTDRLVDVLTYHVVPAVAYSGDLSDGQVLPTLTSSGANLTVMLLPYINQPDQVIVRSGRTTSAFVRIPDVAAGSSVVHVIDKVLRPIVMPPLPPRSEEIGEAPEMEPDTDEEVVPEDCSALIGPDGNSPGRYDDGTCCCPPVPMSGCGQACGVVPGSGRGGGGDGGGGGSAP